MNQIHESLAWLLPAPADFFAQCKALENNSKATGWDVRYLAIKALDINQLSRLAKTLRILIEKGTSLKPLTPLRLGVLSNGTLDYLATGMVATAPRFGVSLEVVASSFDQAFQDAMDPNSTLRKAKPDVVLVALDYRAFGLKKAVGDQKHADALVNAAINQLETIRSGIRESGAVFLVQTLVPPPEALFGSLDSAVSGTIRQMCSAINAKILEKFSGGDSVVCDVNALAETIGTSKWHNPTQWTLAKVPHEMTLVPVYADYVCRLLGAIRGHSRRVLILDLDNTLWGGVIGDDGLGGIRIGQGDPVGEAHLEFQQYALELRNRGIVLAVSSKNDDQIARSPFRKHLDMLLKEEHFAAFQANWQDKASNIEAISKALNLGLDSFVFVDDNPAERELVRQKLPAVAVPEMPVDPAFYTRILAAGGYFEATSFSVEDRMRAEFYEKNAQRLDLEKGSGDINSYLQSLSMKAVVAPFDSTSRARITQLINKSNQFNLTTRRYTEVEVEALEKNPEAFTLQVRLTDKFGNNGMISVIICRQSPESKTWNIDTWLMSCRVLKRRVEEAVLQTLVQHAAKQGISKLVGKYLPTPKNDLVKNHYHDLGFTQEDIAATGTSEWSLSIADYEHKTLPMEIVEMGFLNR